MKKRNVLLILVLFVLGVTSVNAQLNDATVSGPSVKSSNVQPEIHPTPVPMNQRVPHTNTPVKGDEYGSYNYNATFSSGSTAGYVAAPSTFNENFDGAVECWVYPTATTSSAPFIIAKGDATAMSFGLLWINTGSIGFRIGNVYSACTVTGNVPLNQWTHVAASWTGGPSFVITFFVNGVAAGTTVANAGAWAINTDSLTIGSTRAPFGGKDFIGNIDEVRIWTTPRTATDIATNRFIGLGDGAAANTGGALTSAASYTGLSSSYTFNSGVAAYDDISGLTGFYRNGASPVYSSVLSNPLPYNFALLCSFGTNDYVTVPGNAAFNAVTAGTIEAWVKPNAQSTTHMLFSRGTTGFDFWFGIRQSIGNKMVVDIGAAQFVNTDGLAIPLSVWTHIAAKWVQSGANYTVTFYVNGVQSGTPVTLAGTWVSTVGTVLLGGWHGGSANHFNGYLDEVRFWNIALTPAQITKYMFNSCRSGSLPASCVAAWNFDGNLNNFMATTGINGSFNTAVPNNCRLSGYSNESTVTGPPSNVLVAHTTVINRFATPNPFPDGFTIKNTNKPIVDNATTLDTIKFITSRVITSVELFLNIQHTFVGDLTINLIAPNGTSRSVVASAGGTGENILTFVMDGGPVCSTTGFFAPWSYYCGPATAFGSFGGANMLGNWILTVADGAAGDQGTILGWGLRFNGDVVTGVTPVSTELPSKFELSQNYPNPFNPVTKIEYALPKTGLVTMKVYNVLGKEVATLVNEVKNAGNYTVDFNASNLSSGTYFYKIETNGFSDVKRMMLIK
ncbi:MAG: LamG-like jellyroll fold domain-containing protein [Ignavibacteriota bacterium]